MKIISAALIFIGLALLVLIFGPVIKEEINYAANKAAGVKYTLNATEYLTFERPITPPNTDFSIIIPKIDAVAPIIDNVDPGNESAYLKALKQGVAHAAGTPYPGEIGNVYLFAHSTDTFYNVGKYNTVFYLLGKLTKGDEIYIYYKGRQFKYIVDTVKVVNPNEINYLAGNTDKNTLTIQTGYPAGTAFKRLLVTANEIGLQ